MRTHVRPHAQRQRQWRRRPPLPHAWLAHQVIAGTSAGAYPPVRVLNLSLTLFSLLLSPFFVSQRSSLCQPGLRLHQHGGDLRRIGLVHRRHDLRLDDAHLLGDAREHAQGTVRGVLVFAPLARRHSPATAQRAAAAAPPPRPAQSLRTGCSSRMAGCIRQVWCISNACLNLALSLSLCPFVLVFCLQNLCVFRPPVSFFSSSSFCSMAKAASTLTIGCTPFLFVSALPDTSRVS